MPVTLERLIKTIESVEIKSENEFAEQWLGVFEGAIPKEMTSMGYVRIRRESCYGKI